MTKIDHILNGTADMTCPHCREKDAKIAELIARLSEMESQSAYYVGFEDGKKQVVQDDVLLSARATAKKEQKTLYALAEKRKRERGIGNKITLETIAHSDGRIETVMDEVLRCVINTNEQQVRAALIKLGWTPPNHSTNADRDTVLEVWEYLLSELSRQGVVLNDGMLDHLDDIIRKDRAALTSAPFKTILAALEAKQPTTTDRAEALADLDKFEKYTAEWPHLGSDSLAFDILEKHAATFRAALTSAPSVPDGWQKMLYTLETALDNLKKCAYYDAEMCVRQVLKMLAAAPKFGEQK